MEERKKKKSKKISGRQKNQNRKALILICETILIGIIFIMCYSASVMGKIQWSNNDADFYQPKHETKSENDDADEKETDESESQGDNSDAQEAVLQDAANIENYADFMNEYTTFLLIGVDTRDKDELNDKTNNSDVIIICNLNNNTGEIRLVSVMRDTYMRLFSTGEYDKVNRQMALTGIDDLVSMLNYNLDLSIDYYVVVNWAAVVNAVNALGGVEIELTEDEVGMNNGSGSINGYITEIIENTGIAGEPIYEAGLYNLDGVQAVAYCRIRYVGMDYERTERAKKVMGQMLVKAKQANLASLIEIVDTVFPNIATSMDKTDVLAYLTKIGTYQIGLQSTFPSNVYSDQKYCGNIPITYPVVANDFAANVTALHEFLFDVKNYEPTLEVQEVSDYIKKLSGADNQ